MVCKRLASLKNTVIPNIKFQPHDELSDGFELIELESLYKRSSEFSHDLFAPHRVQFHHLIYISKGAGKHFIDFTYRPYEAGSFIFVNKNQSHAFDQYNQPQGLAMLFTQDFIDSIRISIRLPIFGSGFYLESFAPVLTVQDGLKGSSEVLLAEIQKVTGKEPYDRLIIQLLFASLMVLLHRERPMMPDARIGEEDHAHLSHFLALVEEHYTATKDSSAYAEMMNITYKKLNQLCKEATRKTPKQLIDAHTILEAKRRLVIEKTQVSQLAYEFGFEDVSNFAKYFKKHTLMSPTQFQRSIAD